MSSASFRKTLLALAVAGAALPTYAQAVELTNAGILENDTAFTESFEITGSFTSSNSDLDAIELNSVNINGDLTLNATINANGDNADGIDLSQSGEDPGPFGPITVIDGALINKGSISVVGGGSAAMLIDPAYIDELVNEGTLSAKGDVFEGYGVRALEFSGQSELYGNLTNAVSGKILAEGNHATGIQLMGGEIDGKLINNGLIQVSGDGATAIDATSNEFGSTSKRAYLGGIENHGHIIAQGDNAVGLMLDGVVMGHRDYETRHVINTGLINAQGTAIKIGGFGISGEETNYPLRIQNSGTIASQSNAIDASEASGPVYLYASAGGIQGNLLDLSNIEVEGNIQFDGDLIRMKDRGNNGWIDVGSVNTPYIGHIEFVRSHSTIDGNIYVAGNSSLGLSLSSATDANRPVLLVTNRAQFENGSKLVLAAKGSDFNPNGASYRLIQASELIDNGLQVVSSSQLLKVSGLQINSTGISGGLENAGSTPTEPTTPTDPVVVTPTEPTTPTDPVVVTPNEPTTPTDPVVVTPNEPTTGTVVIITKDATELKQLVASNGGTVNTQVTAASFASIVQSIATLNPNDPILKAFEGVSEAQAAKIITQMSAATAAPAAATANQPVKMVSATTGNRMSSQRGANSGDHFKEAGVWVQGLTSDAEQSLRDGVEGYGADTRGVAIGADAKVSENLLIGVAVSATTAKIVTDSGNTADVDGQAITLYGSYTDGNAFVDASFTYGKNDNTTKRQIATTTARGEYDSDAVGLSLMAGYAYQFSNEALIEPRVAARYSKASIDGYTETGSLVGLGFGSQKHDAAELGAGVRVAGNFPVGQGNLMPQATVMGYHDFAADQTKTTSQFALGGTPMTTFSAKPAKNSIEVGVGVDYKLGALTLGVNYDRLEKSDYEADTVTAKARWDF